MPSKDSFSRKNRHVWTPDELEVVRAEYEGTDASAERIAAKVGVTFFAVKGQVQRLGLSKPSGRPWTREEEDRVMADVERLGVYKAARRNNRTHHSVRHRMNKRGMSTRDHSGWFNQREVCDLLGVNHAWVTRRIESGVLKGEVHYPARRPSGVGVWRITEKSLRSFIRRYPEELNGRNVDMLLLVDILVGIELPPEMGESEGKGPAAPGADGEW